MQVIIDSGTCGDPAAFRNPFVRKAAEQVNNFGRELYDFAAAEALRQLAAIWDADDWQSDEQARIVIDHDISALIDRLTVLRDQLVMSL